MASPRRRKTSFILKTIQALAPKLQIGVIEGDTAPSTIDADKVTAAGMPAVQINTGGDCHLDGHHASAPDWMPCPWMTLTWSIVENGRQFNLPAAFVLGNPFKPVDCHHSRRG
jgi:hydrogenase nickel incorporation protein HypB